MANDEQLKILKQGVETWNRWRDEHPEEDIDLSGADLSGAKLNTANFRRANLNGAKLREAELYDTRFARASLQNAGLYKAFLKKTNCYQADFRRVNLRQAVIQQANVSGIDLEKAILTDVDFRATNLSNANLQNATITGTKLYATARDNWVIDGIVCASVYWDREGTERTPNDRDFRPGEFEELYKSLPTIEYYFEHGFTPVDAVLMDKVVQAVNEQHPDLELRLDSFHSRGQPHAVFTVLHTEQAENALQQVRQDYEARIQQLQGKEEALLQVIDMLSSRPQNIELVLGDKRMITTGRDYHEQTDGNVYSEGTHNEPG